mmetsp:Transcript_150531/g.483966  ORF Transcript_150531/g.483966 Transcript_150531/m.483966 type:complete len:563 (-) Transcript_150531:153-1841(-)
MAAAGRRRGRRRGGGDRRRDDDGFHGAAARGVGSSFGVCLPDGPCLAVWAEAFVEDSGYLGRVDLPVAISQALAWVELARDDWLLLARLEELRPAEQHLRCQAAIAERLSQHFDLDLRRRCLGREAEHADGDDGHDKEPESELSRLLRWRCCALGSWPPLLGTLPICKGFSSNSESSSESCDEAFCGKTPSRGAVVRTSSSNEADHFVHESDTEPTFSFECSAGSAALTVDTDGVAVVRGVLDEGSCAEALDAIAGHHAQAAARTDSGEEPAERWFSQRYPQRDDVLLPLGLRGLRGALAGLLRALADPLAELVGADATVIELAAHVSSPGAQPQSFHTDHPWTVVRQVVTCFVALHDIPSGLGPTEVFAGSHAAPVHVHAENGGTVLAGAKCSKDGSRCLFAAGCRGLTLQRGDVALMDARILHRGGGRPPGTPGARTLLYLTLQREGTSYGTEHTPSLLPEYIGRLPLAGWAGWVQSGAPARPSANSKIGLWLAAGGAKPPEEGWHDSPHREQQGEPAGPALTGAHRPVSTSPSCSPPASRRSSPSPASSSNSSSSRATP